jgi:hypothetical protein
VAPAINIVAATAAAIIRVAALRDIPPADGLPDMGSATAATGNPNDLRISCLSNGTDANLSMKTVVMICHVMFSFS